MPPCGCGRSASSPASTRTRRSGPARQARRVSRSSRSRSTRRRSTSGPPRAPSRKRRPRPAFPPRTRSARARRAETASLRRCWRPLDERDRPHGRAAPHGALRDLARDAHDEEGGPRRGARGRACFARGGRAGRVLRRGCRRRRPGGPRRRGARSGRPAGPRDAESAPRRAFPARRRRVLRDRRARARPCGSGRGRAAPHLPRARTGRAATDLVHHRPRGAGGDGRARGSRRSERVLGAQGEARRRRRGRDPPRDPGAVRRRDPRRPERRLDGRRRAAPHRPARTVRHRVRRAADRAGRPRGSGARAGAFAAPDRRRRGRGAHPGCSASRRRLRRDQREAAEVRRHCRGARDDRGRARARPQGDARLPRRRDERRHRRGRAPRARGRVGGPRRQSPHQRRPLPRGRGRARPVRLPRPARPRRDPGVIRRLEVAIFAVAFALAGLVTFAFLWSGDGPYAWLATANGVTGMTYVSHDPCPPPAGGCFGGGQGSVEVMRAWDEQWAAYVTGAQTDPPGGFGREVFTRDEYAHMADVRRVFDGAKVVLAVAVVVLAIRLQRALVRRDALRLVRDGALAATIGVLVVGVVAAVAFDPLFLLFHEVFFPQGNFLFDPASSNLIRLYPDWYWQGITGLVAGSVVAVGAVVAGTRALALRRLRAR